MNIKLRQLRVDRGYSQEELAEMLGISQSQYYRKESGICIFSTEEWDKLSQFFDVPIRDIQDYPNNIVNNHIKKGNSYTHSTITYSDQLVTELRSHIDTIKSQNKLYEKMLEEKNEEISNLKNKINNS